MRIAYFSEILSQLVIGYIGKGTVDRNLTTLYF